MFLSWVRAVVDETIRAADYGVVDDAQTVNPIGIVKPSPGTTGSDSRAKAQLWINLAIFRCVSRRAAIRRSDLPGSPQCTDY